MYFKIKVADTVFGINYIYPTLYDFCNEYIVPDSTPSDYELTITEADIKAEHEEDLEKQFSPQYLETLSCQRKIADILPERNCFLMHGAVITWKNQAYMFTAPSGTGKTTHISLWKKFLGDDVDIVNGDKPFIRIDGNKAIAYGTPWAGKEYWEQNRSAELYGICILHQAKENNIRRLSPQEALPILYPQIHFTDNPEKAALTMDMFDSLLRNIPIYSLGCDISETAVITCFEAMTGLKIEKP